MARKKSDKAPEKQPLVRGPAVQGQAPTERQESLEAGQQGALTVESPGVVRPGEPEQAPEEPTERRPPPTRPEGGGR
jgi:hypothetical protein